MPYTNTPPEGADHGPSIRNPATYEALVRDGKSQAQAAAISNSVLKKGHAKGRHHSGKGNRHRTRRRGRR